MFCFCFLNLLTVMCLFICLFVCLFIFVTMCINNEETYHNIFPLYWYENRIKYTLTLVISLLASF